jgi:octaprenyl-diphosphate synthase
VDGSGAGPKADAATQEGAGVAAAALSAELRDVQALVQESLGDLYPPLIDLARAHVRDVAPPLRAAAVLATGVPTPDSAEARRKRVLLGAALEMLAVALSIHQLLQLLRSEDESPDKSVLGSTILTGDYCFSRAAVLAVGSDSPRVVDIFAQALKLVSEAKLRRQFAVAPAAGTDDGELLRAGAEAAAEMANLPQPARAAALALAAALGHGLTVQAVEAAPLPAAAQARWAALVAMQAAGTL